MPLAILGALSALFSLAKVLIEKFVPDRTTKKSEPYKLHGKAVKKLDDWQKFCKGKPTVAEIAEEGNHGN